MPPDVSNAVAAYTDLLPTVVTGIAVLGGGWLWMSRLYARQAENLNGAWSNENDPESPHEAGSVDLYIEVTGSHVTGHVQAWQNAKPPSFAHFAGWRVGPFVRVHVTHRQAGSSRTGTIRLHYRRKRFLSFSYDGPDPSIPRKAVIWRIGGPRLGRR